MKKHSLLTLLLIIPSVILGENCCCPKGDHYSRSFMYTHPANQNIEVMWALWQSILDDSEDANNSGLEITTLYQKSNPALKNTRYFLFDGNEELLVAGDNDISGQLMPDPDDPSIMIPTCPSRDVRAEWLGFLPDPANNTSLFRGTMTVNPWQDQLMVNIHGRYGFKAFINSHYFENTWFNIYAPIVITRNNLGLKQLTGFDPNNPTGAPLNSGAPTNLYEAFDQPNWNYARMSKQCYRVIQLAELRLTFERLFLARNHVIVMYYSVLSLPTGNKQNPTYIFSPVAGSNGHFGYGAGTGFQIPLNRDMSSVAVTFFINFEGVFYARNEQMRTFDLQFKPWSRYLLYVRKGSAADNSETTPGVNVLTLKARIRPFGSFDLSGGFRVTSDYWEFEMGYDIWGHGRERIDLRCDFPLVWGIAGPKPKPGDPEPAFGECASTASSSTIAWQGPLDLDREKTPDGEFECPDTCKRTFVAIIPDEIDLESAAAQSAFNMKFHVSYGFRHQGEKYDGILGAGCFCEIPNTNAALSLIGVWAKCGVTF